MSRARPSIIGFINYIILIIVAIFVSSFFVAILFALQYHKPFFHTLSDELIFERAILALFVNNPLLGGLLFLTIVGGYLKFNRF